MNTPSPARTLAIAACALLGGWTAAAAFQPRQPAMPPPAPVSNTQYALLTHHSQGALYPNLSGKWYFETPAGRYEPLAMAQTFGLKPGDENVPARILTAIASQGWELVTHTDTAVSVTSVRDGSTWGEDLRRTEQWWFKKN